jgi:hypothetical protein
MRNGIALKREQRHKDHASGERDSSIAKVHLFSIVESSSAVKEALDENGNHFFGW